jgi:hypothetical protein
MNEPHHVRRSRRRRARLLAAAFWILLPAIGWGDIAVLPEPDATAAVAPHVAPSDPDAPRLATPDAQRADPVPAGVAADTAAPAHVDAPAPSAHAVPPRRQEVVIKTILGLLGLVALAYFGGHPRIQEWEARFGVSQVITAGFPFVLLGVVARHPAVGVVTEPVLAQMGTLLGISLGWIGLVAGFRFDARLLGGLPHGSARAVALATSIPFAFVLGLTGISLVSLSGGMGGPAIRGEAFLRDALILGTAGAMTARTSSRLLRTQESATTLSRVIRIEELAGVAGLAIVAAYFRPEAEGTWHLPGTAWLLMSLGLGAAVGIVTYAMLQWTKQARAEFVVLTLGSVSFAAGVAGYLHLSPLVVTFIAGVFLANFPGTYQARLGVALRRLERPVYLLSLFAIGALWDVADWRGWLLGPVFMASRLIGKRVAANVVARGEHLRFGPHEREALAVAPMGPLAIAIVVNAQLLYPGGSITLISSAVIGGAILTEVVVQLVTHGKLPTLERRARQRAAADRPEDSSREATG